jgi:hypothetical protein
MLSRYNWGYLGLFWEDNAAEIRCENMNRTELTQNMILVAGLCEYRYETPGAIKTGNLLITLVTVNCSRTS